jgi:excisionase family DNA binding protein
MTNTAELTDTWFTVEELAAWLKLSKEWIYDSVQGNSIPYHRLGRQLRFRLSDIEQWLKSAEHGPSNSAQVGTDVVTLDVSQ